MPSVASCGNIVVGTLSVSKALLREKFAMTKISGKAYIHHL
jgi:hypothetical protein